METDTLFGSSTLNKPIRFRGMTSLQIGIGGIITIVLILFITISGTPFIGLPILIGIWILLLKGPLKKLNQEHKKGTPNYIGSYLNFSSTPKKILDKDLVFSHLITEK